MTATHSITASQVKDIKAAFVTLKPGVATTAAEIVAHCRATLAGFKVPKHITFGELPKTATGKIQKFEVRRGLKAD